MRQNAQKIPPLSAVKHCAMLVLSLTLLMSPNANAQDITTGLIGHYQLEDDAGTTVVDSAASNDASEVGTVDYGAGIIGQAITFDLTSEYVQLPNSFNIPNSGSLTTTAWVRTTDAYGPVLALRNSGNTRPIWGMYIGNNGATDNAGHFIPLMRHDGTNTFTEFTSTAAINDGTWHHVALVLDRANDQYVAYVDGTAYTVGYTSNTGTSFNNQLAIGGELRWVLENRHGNDERFLSGDIDDVRIYNRALTSSDISALYASGIYDCTSPGGVTGAIVYNEGENVMQVCNGTDWQAIGAPPSTTTATAPTSGLVGHWELDETSGTTAADSSPSGNDGTMFQDLDGTDFVPGILGTALNFAGTDQTQIRVPQNPAINNMSTFTACLWFNADTLTNADSDSRLFLIDKGWFLDIINLTTTPQLRLWVSTSNVYTAIFSTETISPGQWYHVCAVHYAIGTAPDLYINGVDNGTGGVRGNGTQLDDSAQSLSIGSPNTNPYFGNFPGSMDDIRIYNRPLTAGEISNIYDAAISTTNGLIGHWKLDETSGTTATDSAGSNDGTLSGGLDAGTDSVAAVKDNGLSFNGTSDEVTIPSFPGMTSPFSFSAWIKPDLASTTAKSAHVLRGDNTNFYIKWDSDFGPAETLGFFSTTGSNVQTSLGTVTPGQWHHIVGTYDGTTLRAYNNGVEVNTRTTSLIPRSAGQSTLIGNNFEGDVDDVRVYNRVLSATEIGLLYSDPSNCIAPDTGLVGHWGLDETTGSTITDLSGSGNDGAWSDGTGDVVVEETIVGQDGTALSFDGSNDIITIPHSASLDVSSGYTFSTWAYFDSTASTPIVGNIFGKNNSNWGDGLAIGRGSAGGNIVNGRVRLFVAHNRSVTDPDRYEYTNWQYPVDEWVYVTVKWDGSRIWFYRNGARIYGALMPEAPDISVGDVTIGRTRANGGTYHMDGNLDDVRLYNRALSDEEIARLYGSLGGVCTEGPACKNPYGPERSILYNNSNHVMQYCNGENWVAMGPEGNGGGGCTSPTGAAGDMVYNETFNTLQYCEGDDWVATGPSKLVIPTNGLIAHWKMDEITGTNAADSAGSNDGTMNGGLDASADSISGQVDTAFNFDGTDDYIHAGSDASLQITGDLSITFWARMNSLGKTRFINFQALGETEPTNDLYSITLSGTAPHNDIVYGHENSAGNNNSATFDTNLTTGTWYQISLVRDTTLRTASLYLNGSLVSTESYTNNPTGGTSGYLAIAYNIADPNYFDGDIDDIRIYDRVLNATEIDALYHSTN
jgi:hypothetical protein